MDVIDYIRRQFAYNAWANQEVLTSLRNGADSRSLELMSHVLAAEVLWMNRLKQQPQSMRVWPGLDVAGCEAKAGETAEAWREYLKAITAADLESEIRYTNSKGEPWNSRVIDVLDHVIVHSAYHRGQIASHMRGQGKVPAYTDFIHAVRQKLI